MKSLSREVYRLCRTTVEVPIDKAEEQLKNICEIMGTEILWAKGLPLNAAGYITKYYKKD